MVPINDRSLALVETIGPIPTMNAGVTAHVVGLPPVATVWRYLLAAALFGSAVLLGLALGRAGTRRTVRVCAAGGAVVAALSAALLIPRGQPLLRFVLAAAGCAVVMRVWDLLRDSRSWPLRTRLWMLLTFVDLRGVPRTTRCLEGRRLAAMLFYAGLSCSGWALARSAVAIPMSSLALVVRWAGGVVVIYGLADALSALLTASYSAAGYRIPAPHRSPIYATSVTAFWSRHYNLNVSAWLARHVYRPIARRRRPLLALAAAFGASTLLHFWVAWVPLDVPDALLMAAFFLVQGMAASVERAVPALQRLPLPLRRAWTLTWLLAPSPLFVEPFLRIIERATPL